MNFLGRARQLLRSWAPAEAPRPQYYNVACSKGHRLQGPRTEGYQALRCPTCGEGIFILPRSPLPNPPPPPARAKPARSGVDIPGAPRPSRPGVVEEGPIALTDPPPMAVVPPSGGAAAEAEVEIEWIEPEAEDGHSGPSAAPAEAPAAPSGVPVPFDPEIALPAAAPPTPRPKPGAGQRPSPATPKPKRRPPAQPRPAPARGGAAERPMILVQERPGLRDWLKRHRHAVAFVGVAALVVATVSYRVWLQRRQDLPRIVAIGRTQGLTALDEGRFDTAKQLLADARRAVDALGGAVDGAEEIRQGALEAAIFADLVPGTLEELIDQAAASPDGPGRFATFSKGRSIIVQAHVTATPSTSDGYDLDYRIFVGAGPAPARVGRLDLTGFHWIEVVQPQVGDEVLFGARLDAIQLDDRGNEWLIRLVPDSGVTITHFKALEALNWPPPDSSKEGVASRQ